MGEARNSSEDIRSLPLKCRGCAFFGWPENFVSKTNIYSSPRTHAFLLAHISWCAPILRRCISLVSSSALQVDIFVTSRVHKAPKPPPGTGGSKPPQLSWTPAKHPVTSNPTGDSNMPDIPLDSNSRVPIHLAPPSEGSHRRVSIDDHNFTPYDGVSGGQHDDGGLQPKDPDHEMGLGQQDTTHDVLDDGEFDGKDEEVIPGLESFNMRLRQEGVLRRRIARKTTAGRQGQGDLGQRIESPGPGELPSPPHSPHDHEDISRPDDELGERDPTDSISERASTSSSNSVGLMRDVAEVQATLPKTGRGARGEDVVLQFTDEEMEDMLVVAEFTQAGRPKLKLDLFLKEEIERAEGAIIVACECQRSFRFVL